jgi:hypothetical protein
MLIMTDEKVLIENNEKHKSPSIPLYERGRNISSLW